jgi:hypothetical protein
VAALKAAKNRLKEASSTSIRPPKWEIQEVDNTDDAELLQEPGKSNFKRLVCCIFRTRHQRNFPLISSLISLLWLHHMIHGKKAFIRNSFFILSKFCKETNFISLQFVCMKFQMDV